VYELAEFILSLLFEFRIGVTPKGAPKKKFINQAIVRTLIAIIFIALGVWLLSKQKDGEKVVGGIIILIFIVFYLISTIKSIINFRKTDHTS